MNATMATYLIEIAAACEPGLAQALAALRWSPLTPDPLLIGPTAQLPQPTPGAERLDAFVHFMSMTVLPADVDGPDRRAWLLVEVNADGPETTLARRLADAMPAQWAALAPACGRNLRSPAEVASWLQAHAHCMGTTLFSEPGLCFVGTPGVRVGRIRAEAELAEHVRSLLRQLDVPAPLALATLDAVRSKVFQDPDKKWALFSEPAPLIAPRPASSLVGRVLHLLPAAGRDYLWVLLPLPIAAGLAASLLLGKGIIASLSLGLLTLGAEVLLLMLLAGYACGSLRAQERTDDPLDREPEPGPMDHLIARENFREVAQNQLTAQSRLKPGWPRRVSLRLALWLIAELSKYESAPGFLDRIGTIHFARWYLVPGTDRLLFISNYDGSWQSYLEDFIARLHRGLSSVWSNTRDFPKTENLTEGGAADAARFKRWARRQQLPTAAWFTAYPRLTAASIRTNAAIRHGLASATTEEQAAQWLSRTGYSNPDKLETSDVPTLVFSGLSRLRFAHVFVVRFQDRAGARQLLAQCLDEVSFGPPDRQAASALVAGLTAQGLELLGMPEPALKGFPVAFTQGMNHEARARILGDYDTNPELGPSAMRWGLGADPVHMIFIVYASSRSALDARQRELEARFETSAEIAYQRPLAPLPDKGPLVEPFGFRDGISQPILRGLRDRTAARNEQHVVEIGEVVLGYRDNLGQRAPTPTFEGRDFGRDGTFLVVRQLTQDVAAFNNFVNAQARRVARLEGEVGPSLRPALRDAREWVAARMVGRWRDGRPLVRQPEAPVAAEAAQAHPRPENDFFYGAEDPTGWRCPLGAHIRRANPRDSLDPSSPVQLAISNRHRILRRGRRMERRGGECEGMFFMCLNADIERQFEFLQQTWLLGPNFHELDSEMDPLLGPGGSGQALSVPSEGGTLRLEPLSRFVRAVGGGYFFLPGKACLETLAADDPAWGRAP